MKLNEIYLGDAYKLIKELPNNFVDLIVTDPPYQFGAGSLNSGLFKHRKGNDSYSVIRDNGLDKGFNLSILDEFVRVMKKINIYLWCNKEQIYDYLTYFVIERKCNFEIIVWAKTNVPPFTSCHYLKDKEYCLFFWDKGVKVNPSYDSGKTFYLSKTNTYDKSKFNHPTIKPLAIVKNLIKNSCGNDVNSIVLDPFVGSGTTAVACKELGFNYIGFEINKTFHKIAIDRLNGIEASGQVRLF